jgi:hypothetical protein
MPEVAQMREPEAVYLKSKNDIYAEFGASYLVMIRRNTFDFQTFYSGDSRIPDDDRVPGNCADIIMVAVAMADGDDIGG